MKAPVQDLYAQLAKGKNIELLPGGLYVVDDKTYYIQIDQAGGAQPIVRTVSGQQELLLPVKEKIIYTILFKQSNFYEELYNKIHPGDPVAPGNHQP